MGHMGSAHGAKAKRLCVPGMGHLWDIWDMNALRLERGQAHSFAWLMARRPEASSTELGTGHKQDKQDMVPDTRDVPLAPDMKRALNGQIQLLDTTNRAVHAPNAPQMSHKSSHNAFWQSTRVIGNRERNPI